MGNTWFKKLVADMESVSNHSFFNLSSYPCLRVVINPQTSVTMIKQWPKFPVNPLIHRSLASQSTLPQATPSRSIAKLPSLDFTKGLQASNHQHHEHYLQDFGHGEPSPLGHSGHFISHASGGAQRQSPRLMAGNDHLGHGMSFDGVSVASGRGSRRRRPGIPHSKICTICNTYVYIFRTRCLVRT